MQTETVFALHYEHFAPYVLPLFKQNRNLVDCYLLGAKIESGGNGTGGKVTTIELQES